MGLPMDEVDVEIAPGADLTADPSTWTWVNICAAEEDYPNGRVQRPVTITHGRSSEGSSARPSTCTLVVRNEDGAFTPANPLGPWYGELGKGTPLRVTWSGSERFSGFISELPTRWLGVVDNSRVTIRADGITRRVEQGAPTLNSPLFRSLSTDSRVVAYWPCEDNDGSESAASPIMGVSPWSMPADFASVDGPPGSDRLLRVTTDTASTLARVPNHTPGATYHVQVAYQIEDESGTRSLLVVHTTSDDVARWHLHITDTTFRVQARDGDGTLIVNDSEALDHSMFGQWVRVELRLSDSGGAISWTARIFAVDVAQTQLNELTGSESGDKGRVTRVGVGNGGDWAQDRNFGHLAVLTGASTELVSADLHKPFHGYTTELAADRFERLCDEQDLSCSIVAPTGGMRVDGSASDYASAPDAAALKITGDLDIRAWISLDDWSLVTQDVIEKWEDPSDRSYSLRVTASGGLRLLWSTDGTSGTTSSVDSAAIGPQPPDGGRLAIRATLDVDNGSSEHVVTFYIGPSLGGPWTQIGSETISGTTSIHSGAADLVIAVDEDFDGVVHAARLYDGIDGTLVADPDFTEQTIGATSFDDDQGNTWTVNGDAAIVRADDTMPMGPQQIDTLLANMRACAVSDDAVLFEDEFGLGYRTNSHRLNATHALTIDQTVGELDSSPEPTDDDRYLVNDVTAQNQGGASAHRVDQDSIDTYGKYATALTVSASPADLLDHIATWALHKGTVDELRWPVIPMALHTQQSLIPEWLAVTPTNNRMQITHDIAEILGLDIDQNIEGWIEIFGLRTWDVVLNCVPASPFTVWQLEHDTYGRIDTSGAETSGSFDAGTDTSLTVVTTAERPWINSTDHAAQFPFEIAVSGVVLNVTAISGSTSPQTFTVTQAPVNGVEKTIASGSAVHIHPIPVLAL